jgi:coenzyme F420-0:L-glutamate ligase/coenzyme F420-1:gamma-L-glutamate ligase
VISIIPLSGIPEVQEGDDLGRLIVDVAAGDLKAGDVIVVTQKVVSKAEGRLKPSHRKKEVIAEESQRVLRRSGEMVIAETRHGFVCANAGVDESNVPVGYVSLLPIDPDLSARRIRARIKHLTGIDVRVVVSDTFGRAWRLGQTDVAIGVAGFEPFCDYVGTTDTQGREMRATRICVADEIAGAAEMVMGKASGVCVALVRGVTVDPGAGSAAGIARPPQDDLFR